MDCLFVLILLFFYFFIKISFGSNFQTNVLNFGLQTHIECVVFKLILLSACFD